MHSHSGACQKWMNAWQMSLKFQQTPTPTHHSNRHSTHAFVSEYTNSVIGQNLSKFITIRLRYVQRQWAIFFQDWTEVAAVFHKLLWHYDISTTIIYIRCTFYYKCMYNCYNGHNQFTKIWWHRLGLLFSWRASEVVKANVEPVVDITVQFVVFTTDLPWSQTLFNCFCLRSRTILIRSTDIQDVVIPQSAEPVQRMNRTFNAHRQTSR